ncbi:MAG: helix-turn-helix domain-containing protein [Clostridia bacterium]|nr:helix-turn-helix domain-containing protein [Clostridia bacterium]
MSFYEVKAEQRDYFYFCKTIKNAETPPHFHSAIELIFCLNGKQEVCVGGESKILERGDAYFCDSYVVHSLKRSGAEVYVVLGDRAFFQTVFSRFGDKVPSTFFHFEDFDILHVLDDLYRREKKNTAGRAETNKAIIKFLLTELYEKAPFVARKEDKQNELVEKILRYATEHFSKDLSLPAIAKIFGYSRDYLSRVLHRYLSCNWNVYVGGVRARAVNELLQNHKDASVLEIAYKCGFESPNTFYRAYRREFGCTPLENDNF